MPTLIDSPSPVHSTSAAPYIPWSERPKLTPEECSRVNDTRNAALYDAEHDPGTDGCGLTPAEVSAWVRQAEADAVASIHDARERAEAESCPTVEDVVAISRVSELEWLGFELGCNGEAVAGSPEYTPEELAAFLRGHEAGFKAYEEAEAEEWDLEWARRDVGPNDHLPEAEAIERVGVIAVRRGGGL